MAKFPALPLWTDAYLADTTHLSTLQHGAYLLLLMAMWRHGGSLPYDDKVLARVAGLNASHWARNKPDLMAFFDVADGRIYQGRLSDELEYVREHSRNQSKRAKGRWRGQSRENKPEPGRNLDLAPPSNPLENNNAGDARAYAPTPTPTKVSILSAPTVPDHAPKAGEKGKYPEDFDAAWLAYPRHRNMSKAEALPPWLKLSTEDRVAVTRSIPEYVAYLKSKPGHEILHFCRYLKSRRFEGFAQPEAADVPETSWRQRLLYARNRAIWSTREWGPKPGQSGCMVPASLLEAEDGKGWAEDKGRAA